MTRRRGGKLLLAGIIVVIAALVALAWRAGGPQPVREIAQDIAVPEIAR